MTRTVYLAGPTVFAPDAEALFATMKRICVTHGLLGVAPLDNQIDLAGREPGRALARDIVAADIALMHRVDAAVFCLDGFRRGPEMDPGTAFEIGYMHALNKPLAGWTRDVRDYPARVACFLSLGEGEGGRHPTANAQSGTAQSGTAQSGTAQSGTAQSGTAQSGTQRDPDGILIHSEGCFQNAMTEIGIERSGGRVYADRDWTAAFAAAIAGLATRLRA